MSQAAGTSYTPGNWFGIVGENATVLLPPSEKARAGSLWALVDDGGGFDEVLDALVSSGLRTLPGFVLVAEQDGVTHVVVRGSARARFETAEGRVEVDGSTAATWVERALTAVSSMHVDLGEDAGATDQAVHVVTSGLVRVSSLQVPPPAAPTAPPPPTAPSTAPPTAPPAGATAGAAPGAGAVAGAAGGAAAGAAAAAAGTTGASPGGWSGDEDAGSDQGPALSVVPPLPDAPATPPAPDPLTDPLTHSPDGADDSEEERFDDEPTDVQPAVSTWDDDLPRDRSFAGTQTGAGPEGAAADDTGEFDAHVGSAPGFPPPAPGFPPPPVPAPGAPSEPPPGRWRTDDDHDGLTRGGAPAGGDPSPASAGFAGQPQSQPTAHPVALLEFSSGDRVEVDRALIIGRAPQPTRFDRDDEPRLVTVPSPHQEISSTHCEIRPGTGPDQGAAVVVDLGSTNGTVLVQPGMGAEELRPGVPVQLMPGAVVDLGDGLTIRVSHP